MTRTTTTTTTATIPTTDNSNIPTTTTAPQPPSSSSTATATAPPPASDYSDMYLLTQGFNYLYVTSQSEKAIEAFDTILAVEPDHKEAIYHKGVALYIQARFSEAIELQDRVLSQDPGYIWGYVIKGNALNEQGLFSKAMETFEECVKHAPYWDVCRNAQGNGYFLQEEYEKAIHMYNKSIELALRECQREGLPVSEQWRHCGTCLSLLNKGLGLFCIHQFDLALECFQKIRVMTHKLVLHIYRSRVSSTGALSQHFVDSTERMANLLLIDDNVDDSNVNNNNNMMEDGTDMPQGGNEHIFKQYDNNNSNNRTNLSVAELLKYCCNGFNSELVHLIKNNRAFAYDTRTAYCVSHCGIALCCAAMSQMEHRQQHQQQHMSFDNSNNNKNISHVGNRYGSCSASLNSIRENMLQTAYALAEDDRMQREVFYFMGESNRNIRDYEQALECYSCCISKNENEFRSMIGVGRVCMAMGDYRKAKGIFSQLLNKLPYNELALQCMEKIRRSPWNFSSQFNQTRNFCDCSIITEE